MLQLKVEASEQEIAFEIEDGHGNQARFQLGRRSATMLIALVHQAMMNLPPEDDRLQDTRPPFLRGRPAMELSIAPNGDIVLSCQKLSICRG